MDDTTAVHYTTRYDNELDKIPHYSRYPRMRPFIGTHYGKTGPKILLIAESHYLPEESTIHLKASNWYAGNEAALNDKERKWISTRGILNKSKGRWHRKGHTIYRHLEQTLVEAGLPACDNTFRYVAFMNGFQRPAVSRRSIAAMAQDVEISSQTVGAVIDLLKPDHVVFVSSKAKRLIGTRLNHPSHYVPHPASAWWHRESKKGTGKRQFTRLIAGFLNAAGYN